MVLGGGVAGLACATHAANLGAKVALVEQELLGGTSLNMGSVPSKALLRAANAAHEVRGDCRLVCRWGSVLHARMGSSCHYIIWPLKGRFKRY